MIQRFLSLDRFIVNMGVISKPNSGNETLNCQGSTESVLTRERPHCSGVVLALENDTPGHLQLRTSSCLRSSYSSNSHRGWSLRQLAQWRQFSVWASIRKRERSITFWLNFLEDFSSSDDSDDSDHSDQSGSLKKSLWKTDLNCMWYVLQVRARHP